MSAAVGVSRRRLWLECEVHASPVWESPDRAADLDTLPLSRVLRDDLRKWADDYDARVQIDYDFTPDEDREMTERGRQLAERVQLELGPAWEIGYLDLQRGAVVWPRADLGAPP